MGNGETIAVCGTCPRHCRLSEGALGFCRARKAEGGRVVAANYGKITSLALDPSRHNKCPERICGCAIGFFTEGGNPL